MDLDHHLRKLGLASLLPDARDLIFYLGDFLQVTATFVVGNLGFEFVDLLLVLPVSVDSVDIPDEGSDDEFGLSDSETGHSATWHSNCHQPMTDPLKRPNRMGYLLR
jgi:hypothetical protein